MLNNRQLGIVRQYINNGFKLASVAYGGAHILYYDRSNEGTCGDCTGKRIGAFLASMTLQALFDQDFMDDAQSRFEASAAYEALDHHVELFPDWQYNYARGEWLDYDGIPYLYDTYEEGPPVDCDCDKRIEACYGDPNHYGETGELCDNPECIECKKLRV